MHGQLSGKKDGSFVTLEDMLSFDHDEAYKAGEEITNIATSGLRTPIGAHLIPFAWRYTISTQPSQRAL